MGSRLGRRNHVWCVQPLTPLLEGPDPGDKAERARESSWVAIRTWVRAQVETGNRSAKRRDLKLILGVLGCPLAPIPSAATEPTYGFSIRDGPIETSSACYIIHQYLAATGCLKAHQGIKSMYAAGSVRMVSGHAESGSARMPWNASAGVAAGGGANGCFVVWQMSPRMWLMELVVAGYKVAAGSDGRIVWRHLPWLGMSAARGPRRPLRRIIQGLDPKSTASMFTKAQCLGEKRIGDHDCFVLKVSADRSAIVERSDGAAEVISHVLYGYFSQKSGLLVYVEDSQLTRIQALGSDAIHWETTFGSSIEDYRDVEGVLVAHRGRSVATLFRFGESPAHQSRTRLEETWRIDDVAFNIAGLSMDCFIPPLETLSDMKSS